MKTEAIVWCIENCSAYVYGDEAQDEYRALVEHIEAQAARITDLLDLLEQVVSESRPPAFTPHGTSAFLSDATVDRIIEACRRAGRDVKLAIRE